MQINSQKSVISVYLLFYAVPRAHSISQMKSARCMMLLTTVLVLLLLPLPTHSTSAHNPSMSTNILEIFQQLKEESDAIREEAHQVRQEGYAAMSKAYEVRDAAYEIKDSTYEARRGLEALLVEAFALLKSQTTATGLYIHDIKNTLADVSSKMDGLEAKIEGIESKLDETNNKLEEDTLKITAKLDEKMAQLEEKVSAMGGEIREVKRSLDETSVRVETSITLSTSVKDRQQVWMSEVRLISLYKTVDQNNGHPGYPNPIVTDGNFVINNVGEHINTHSHTLSKATNNKLWINLGGYFKIHRVYIWNYRACCHEQLVGTHIYADEELIGAVVQNSNYHDFLIPENDPTYGSTVTLLQPLPRNIHVLEIQVWGSGPFNRDDIFV